jgi:hypothetical protein
MPLSEDREGEQAKAPTVNHRWEEEREGGRTERK